MVALNISRTIHRAIRAFYLRHEIKKIETGSYIIGKQIFDLPSSYKIKYNLLRDKYQITTLYNWNKVIKADWTNERKYNLDKYRCTDFAVSFKARMADEFGLNVGMVVTPSTVDSIGHSFNCIVIYDESLPVLKYYMKWFEPQNDKWVEAQPGSIYDLSNARIWF